jgi:hypothetical protein
VIAVVTLARTEKPAKQIQALLCSLDLFVTFCIKGKSKNAFRRSGEKEKQKYLEIIRSVMV